MAFFYRFISILPFPVLYGLSSLMYVLVYYVFRYRRKVVRDNLTHAYPEKSEAELQELEKRFFRFICDNTLEGIKTLGMTGEQAAARVTLENPEVLDAYMEKQQSVIILAIHQANNEWVIPTLGIYLPCELEGWYKPLHNKAADALLHQSRSRFGKPVALADSTRELLRGRKRFRAILSAADQRPITKQKRYWTKFYNRWAPFFHGPQTMAAVTGYPVIFMQSQMTKRGHYSARFEVLCEGPYDKNGTDVVERYVEVTSRAIDAQPETWWWSNRRWKPMTDNERQEVLEQTGSPPD